MIIMDEYAYVKNLMDTKPNLEFKKAKPIIIRMLSAYFNNDPNCYEIIAEYMKYFYPDSFHIEYFDDFIKKMIKENIKKDYHLNKVDSIDIYENEIDILRSIEDNNTKKLLFACIVIARMRGKNGWLCIYDKSDIVELFNLVNLTANNRVSAALKSRYFGKLEKMGYLRSAVRIDSVNERVEIEPQGDVVMTITSLENLGNQYLITECEETHIMCRRCGKIVKKTGNKKRYCKWCADKNTRENKAAYMRRERAKTAKKQ